MPFGERDVAALRAHVRVCERILPTERPAADALLGDVLRHFDINITLG